MTEDYWPRKTILLAEGGLIYVVIGLKMGALGAINQGGGIPNSPSIPEI